MLRKEKGITLVALVVTIIVLLILAAVSINLVIGDNGIITRAKEAKKSTINANDKDNVYGAVLSAMTIGEGRFEEANLVKELNNYLGQDKYTLNKLPDKYYVFSKETNKTYEVKFDGKVNEKEIEKVEDENPGELSGTGTESDPYLIQSVEDLVFFSLTTNDGSNYNNKYLKLTHNLDFFMDESYANPNSKYSYSIEKERI